MQRHLGTFAVDAAASNTHLSQYTISLVISPGIPMLFTLRILSSHSSPLVVGGEIVTVLARTTRRHCKTCFLRPDASGPCARLCIIPCRFCEARPLTVFASSPHDVFDSCPSISNLSHRRSKSRIMIASKLHPKAVTASQGCMSGPMASTRESAASLPLLTFRLVSINLKLIVQQKQAMYQNSV